MHAALANSIYREKPFAQAGEDILSYRTTMFGDLPDLHPSYISNTEMTVPYLMTQGERVLLFSTEFPTGVEDTLGVIVDNLNGTWTAQFTGAYIEVFDNAYNFPFDLNSYPQIHSQAATTVDRMLFEDTVLGYVSGTDIEFVGTNARAGMLKVGDVINVTYNDTVEDLTTDVTLTSVTEAGATPTTYTCGFDALSYPVEPVDADVANRIILNTLDGSTREGDPTLPGFRLQYNEQYSPLDPDNVWMVTQRQITSPINWTITEPLVLDYTTTIQ